MRMHDVHAVSMAMLKVDIVYEMFLLHITLRMQNSRQQHLLDVFKRKSSEQQATRMLITPALQPVHLEVRSCEQAHQALRLLLN